MLNLFNLLVMSLKYKECDGKTFNKLYGYSRLYKMMNSEMKDDGVQLKKV